MSYSYSTSMSGGSSMSYSTSYTTYYGEGEMPEMPEGSTTYETFSGEGEMPAEI